MSLLLLFIFNIGWAQTAPAATVTPTYVFEGQLLEKGTRKPLSDVNIFILPQKLKGVSDKTGHFKIEGIPAGEVEMVINATGYNKFSKAYEVTESQNSMRIFVERQSYRYFETTVSDLRSKKDDSQKTLKQEDFLQMPGSNGDPVKAVQNLPGVNRTAGGAQIIIQGSEPDDTRYNIDGHEVPLIFHFGGLSSIVTPEAVDSVDYLSAAYGPQFGRALGGHVGLNVRKPQLDRHHGMAFMDIYNMGFLVEGPLSPDSGYLVSGRYSYIGYVLKAAAKDNEDFNLTVAPTFYDLNAQYFKKLNDTDELRVFSILSKDKLEFVLNKPVGNDPKLRGDFNQSTEFYRVIPEWSRQLDADRKISASVGAGANKVFVNIGDIYLDIKSSTVSARAEYEQKFSPLWTTQTGTDSNFAWYQVAARAPNTYSDGGVSNPLSTGDVRDASVSGVSQQWGLYTKNQVKWDAGSAWTVLPGLRADRFTSSKENLLQPRLGARYEWSKSLTLRGATGLYFQEPAGQYIDSTFGNPDIKSERAVHFALGFDKDFREGSSDGFTLSATAFYKKLDKLIVSSSQLVTRDGALTPENYTNAGEGRIHGFEIQSKYKLDQWSLITAYTYSQSRRQKPGEAELPSPYDQTHSLNLLGSYEEGPWQYGARFRYVTGNPYTGIVGSYYDADKDVYVPQRGALYGERNKAFMQLDIRIDRKWVYDTWILSGYLDIQNVTNQKNQEGVNYSYDYKEKNEITGLPMLPTLGVKGEF